MSPEFPSELAVETPGPPTDPGGLPTDADGPGRWPLRFGGILALTPGEKAHCPIDDWDFEPRFTDGRCPLCGWRPPGPPITAPRVARLDWFWPMVGLLAVVSVVMGVLVLIAYSRA